jgi:hypothetical protein
MWLKQFVILVRPGHLLDRQRKKAGRNVPAFFAKPGIVKILKGKVVRLD